MGRSRVAFLVLTVDNRGCIGGLLIEGWAQSVANRDTGLLRLSLAVMRH